jgi:hypothetical protein
VHERANADRYRPQDRNDEQNANLAAGTVMPMAYSRQWLVDTLRRLGFSQEADEALQVLPDEIDRKQLLEFADRHGINSSTLIDRMGGSP